MKYLVLVSTLFLLNIGFSQDATSVDLKPYFSMQEGDTYVYHCIFDKPWSDEVVIEDDTTIVKQYVKRGVTYSYFWEYESGKISVFANSFFNGAFYIEADQFKRVPVWYEDQLYRSGTAITAFPTTIEIGKVYESTSNFSRLVEYEFSETDENDVLLLAKSSHYETKVDVDSIWLKKDVGVIRYLRATGRDEVLVDHFQGTPEVFEQYGGLYKNLSGDEKYKCLLVPVCYDHKRYSHAEYNNCQLIKETFFGTIDEMLVRYIVYEYDGNGNVIKERSYYTGTTVDFSEDLSDYDVWTKEFTYHDSGNIASMKAKVSAEESYYLNETYDDSEGVTFEDKRRSKRHELQCEDN